MGQTLEEISKTLPRESRLGFTSAVLADAVVLAQRLGEEVSGRHQETMRGVEQLRRGEYLTRAQWERQMDWLEGELAAKS